MNQIPITENSQAQVINLINMKLNEYDSTIPITHPRISQWINYKNSEEINTQYHETKLIDTVQDSTKWNDKDQVTKSLQRTIGSYHCWKYYYNDELTYCQKNEKIFYKKYIKKKIEKIWLCKRLKLDSKNILQNQKSNALTQYI